jgi:hypothetical protein
MRILLGPILFIMEGAPENVRAGVILTAVLVLVIGLCSWKRWWLGAIAAAASWLFLGFLANTANC